LRLGSRIGGGGEGTVYEVLGTPSEVAKIFLPSKNVPMLEHKLAWLIANPPSVTGSQTRFAWPTERIHGLEGGHRCFGYVMPRAEGSPLLLLTSFKDRLVHAPHLHWGQLLAIAQNLCNLVYSLHRCGFVVGDVNESNFCVDLWTGVVTMIDCDSIQAIDGATGQRYPCEVGKAEFTPPESQGPQAPRSLDPSHDHFALAILVFHLIFEGTHPFAGVDDHPAQDMAARIRRGATPFVPGARVQPAPFAPALTLLDAATRALVRRAFGSGLFDPRERPSAAEWSAVLHTCRTSLVLCPANPAHRFVAAQGRCPWCERAALFRVDPYPQPLRAANPGVSPPVLVSSPPMPSVSASPFSSPPVPWSQPKPGVLQALLLHLAWLLLLPLGAAGVAWRSRFHVWLTGVPAPLGPAPAIPAHQAPMSANGQTMPLPAAAPIVGLSPGPRAPVALPHAGPTAKLRPSPWSAVTATTSTMPAVPQMPMPARGLRPTGTTVVASKNRQYFHRPNCSWAARITGHNLVTYASAAAARQQGRVPCRTCGP